MRNVFRVLKTGRLLRNKASWLYRVTYIRKHRMASPYEIMTRHVTSQLTPWSSPSLQANGH